MLGAFGVDCPKVSTFLASLLSSALNHIVKLVTTDEKKTVVAEFHPANYLAKRRKARLEVHHAGIDMLDYIILTFVFVENKRRVREESIAESSGRGFC